MDNNKYHISWSEQQRLTDATYDDFLKSKEWQDKVNARMKIANYRCEMCGSKGSMWNVLECHHWGYQSPLGEEDVYTQLSVLCHVCHKMVHKLLERPTAPDGSSKRIKNPHVPSISVWTYSGREIAHRLHDLEEGRSQKGEINEQQGN